MAKTFVPLVPVRRRSEHGECLSVDWDGSFSLVIEVVTGKNSRLTQMPSMDVSILRESLFVNYLDFYFDRTLTPLLFVVSDE